MNEKKAALKILERELRWNDGDGSTEQASYALHVVF